MSTDPEDLKQNISRSVMIYIIGCCCFVLIALISIWFGYYLIRYHNDHELPLQLIVISLAGGVLLWEILKAMHFKTDMPSGFRLIAFNDYPELFRIINEVTDRLHLSPIKRVYVSPDAAAAVIIQPKIRNLISDPERNLVIGLGFLTQMDDDEIRAVLYHEFGHYVQTGMKSSLSVYVAGQFSRSFVSIKEKKKENTWQQQLKLQLLMFTYFTIWFCDRINRSYSKLAKQMEYEADDIAIKYVGAGTFQRALIHAACIRYNFEVLQWGLRQLQDNNIQVDNIYIALHLVEKYSRPSRKLLSDEIVRRLERIGQLDYQATGSQHTGKVRKCIMQNLPALNDSGRVCSAVHFAKWLREGFIIYSRQRELDNAVLLEIHLDKKRHKLPLVDATYKILLDGREIGKGNFIRGYTLRKRTSPGKHVITVYAPSGIISTPFEFMVEADNEYRIEMDYKVHFKDGIYDVFGEKISII